MTRKKRGLVAGVVSMAVVAASSLTALAANVDVYAEGAYTDTKLDVYIYADVNAEPLVSAGVRLNYDNTKLTFVSAEKNETDWYFGAPGATHEYQNPQNTGDAVVFLGGKLDTAAPGAGVSGTRKLIGKATFNRTENSSPGLTSEAHFGADLGLGIVRTPPDVFANFVTTSGAVLDTAADGVSYAVMIRERGDANANGSITVSDMTTVKNAVYANAPLKCVPAADCNASESITVSDMTCIKNKVYTP